MRPGSAIAASASRLRVFSLRELVVHRRRTTASIAVMAVSAMYLVAVIGIFGSITGSVNRLADGIAGVAALEVSGITDAGFPDTITADVGAVARRRDCGTDDSDFYLHGIGSGSDVRRGREQCRVGRCLERRRAETVENPVREPQRCPGRASGRSRQRADIPAGLRFGHGHGSTHRQAARRPQRRTLRPGSTCSGAEHNWAKGPARLDTHHDKARCRSRSSAGGGHRSRQGSGNRRGSEHAGSPGR